MCSTYRPYVGLQSIWSCSIIKQHQNEVFLWFIHWRAILKSYRPILSKQLRRLLCTAIEQSSLEQSSLEQSFTSYYISVTLTSSLHNLNRSCGGGAGKMHPDTWRGRLTCPSLSCHTRQTCSRGRHLQSILNYIISF